MTKATESLISARQAEARAVRGCQLLKRELAAANEKLKYLRDDTERLAAWAGEQDGDFARQVALSARARLGEWNKPLAEWEP